MGCVSSSSSEDPEAAARNAAIESGLRKDRAAMQREVKILFLGAGESGKSTIVKQMRLKFKGTYTDSERAEFKDVIYSNAVQSMQVVIDALEMLGLEVPPSLDPHIKFILGLGEHPVVADDAGALDHELCVGIKAIWAADCTKECVEMSHEYQLNDSASYFFDSIDRIGSRDYLPTDLDILRARVKSTGIAEASFDVGGMRYRCFDVGGQRSERKKWVHCFEDVQVLIFILNLHTEFNQMLYEDESVSRLTEATTLWDSIANSRWFKRTAMILFLNKIDLFQEKLKLHKFVDYMPEYTGPNEYSPVAGYLLQHFSAQYRNPDRELFHHLTCATDSKQISIVLSAVNEQILTANLLSSGMM